MKTGMEWGLAGLALVLVAVLGWSMWSNAQVDMAVGRVDALAAGQDLPPQTLGIAKLGIGWIVGAVVGTALTGFGVTMATKAWPLIKRRITNDDKRRWVGGPNANYGRERAPRAPSSDELMRTMLMRQMMSDGKTPRMEVRHGDDEPRITF